jgi:hypothetical protein
MGDWQFWLVTLITVGVVVFWAWKLWPRPKKKRGKRVSLTVSAGEGRTPGRRAG